MRVRGFMVIYLECLRIPPIWLKYVWFSFAEIFSNYNFRYFNFKKIFHVKFLKFWFHNFLSSIFFGIILISIKKNTKMILITMIMTCKRINYWKKKILRVSQFLWNYKMLINTFWWFSTVKIYQTRVMIVFMNVWFTSPINQFTLL